MKTLRMLAALVLITGAVFTARSFYLRAKAELAGVLIRHAWAQTIATGTQQKPWAWADTRPIARLTSPRLGYDEIVLEGASPRTLAFGPAHMLSGANFGEPGNLILAGHRTSWFLPLEKIAKNDVIEIQWLDSHNKLQTRTYTVEQIHVVNPRDTKLLRPTADDRLTLITCYPFGVGPTSPQRFIVKAKPTTT
jgi:sortase A